MREREAEETATEKEKQGRNEERLRRRGKDIGKSRRGCNSARRDGEGGRRAG